MTKVQDLPQIDALSGDDVFYVADASNPSAPDKKVQFSQMVPAGVKITHHFRYEGGITIPTLSAGTEGSGTITVPGAVVGDHVVFNPTSALAADIGILSVRVSAADTVSVKFRNFSGSSFSSAAVACVALVTRSTS